jgi:ubiquinone/menaquinone biosynthesis C-methylase UbiE
VPEKPIFDEQVSSHYEAWYETSEGRHADALEKASLRRILESFPQPRSVLEVGCGTGHFTRWLREQGLAAVGLDLSQEMLAEAQILDGLPLVRADAHRLPFADGTFDLVALVTALEFLEAPEEAVAEALRVTRRGLLLGVLNRWSLLGLKRRLTELLRPTVYRTAQFYSVGELKRLLKSVAGAKGRLVWETTLHALPEACPQQPTWPWGGFIAMGLLLQEE